MSRRISAPVRACALALAGIVASGLALNASAQTAGSYVGTTSQGQPITVTLADDGNGGLNFFNTFITWNKYCGGAPVAGATNANLFYGNVPLTTPRFVWDYPSAFSDTSSRVHLDFKFTQDGQGIKGTVKTETAEFVDTRVSKSLQRCGTGSTLSFTAHWQGTAQDAQAVQPASVAPAAAANAAAPSSR